METDNLSQSGWMLLFYFLDLECIHMQSITSCTWYKRNEANVCPWKYDVLCPTACLYGCLRICMFWCIILRMHKLYYVYLYVCYSLQKNV